MMLTWFELPLGNTAKVGKFEEGRKMTGMSRVVSHKLRKEVNPLPSSFQPVSGEIPPDFLLKVLIECIYYVFCLRKNPLPRMSAVNLRSTT